MAAALVLTKEQWAELVEAIGSKVARVERGQYDDLCDGFDSFDKDKWIADLKALQEEVLKALASQGVPV
jgi:hypothetical protein